MINPMDLTGKLILVTGASSGIGRETAIHLSKLGAKVVLVARNEEKLKETLRFCDGNENRYYCFDLTEIVGIENLINKIVLENNGLDGLAYCAGVSTNRPLAMYKFDRVHEVMLINFYAFFELIRIISKKGNYNPGLSIVGLSSIASIKGNAAQTAYAASKAAMDGSMRCLAKELSGKKIRVNTILPSMINTEMYRSYSRKSGVGEETILKRQYLGIGETTDVANAVAFLLSDASAFVTGTQLPVDGGYTSS
ncbi:MAG: SDR family oxidoreductase [Ignavibacteriales bacterium]|nr:SDR family oxidoreductase [Ignavibacteriales bacterium]